MLGPRIPTPIGNITLPGSFGITRTPRAKGPMADTLLLFLAPLCPCSAYRNCNACC